MMTCEAVRPRLTAFLDQELTTEDAQDIQQHLGQCTACTEVLGDYSSIQASVASAQPFEADDVWDAVSAQIGAEDSSQAVLNELRRMSQELALLRGEVHGLRSEVTGLRLELAKRLPEPVTRRLPLSLPSVPQAPQRPYRLV